VPLGRYGEGGVDFEIGGVRWCLTLSLQFGRALLLRDDGVDVGASYAMIICLSRWHLTRSP
jgi:hypothetical protein